MFRKYTVPVPSVPGKIRVKKNGNGSRYVEYEVGRKYNREKKYNVPVRKTIGLLDDGDETRMYPNDNYFVFFSPLDSGYVYEDEHSSCLKAGAFIVIKEALETYGMDRWLRSQFGDDHAGLAMDLISYMIITEHNSAQHYPDYAYSHPLFTPKGHIYSDSSIGRFLNEDVTRDTVIGFTEWWNKARGNRRNPVYISYDSTNFISSAVQPAVIEPGHAKDGSDGDPVINVAVGFDVKNGTPLFYEDYCGSVVDVSQLEFAVGKAEALGYRNIGFILDRGYFSRDNFTFLDSRKTPYIACLRGRAKVVESLILKHKNTFEQRHENHIPLYNLFGISDDVVSDGLYSGDTSNRHFHLYFSKERMSMEMDAITSSLTNMKESLDRLMGTDCSMKDMKIYETFFNPVYSYETRKSGEKTEKKGRRKKEGDDNLPPKAKILVMYTENSEAIDRAYSLCGYFCLVSSEKISASEACVLYKSRDASEKLFSADKTFLGGSAFRVCSENSIRAKMFITFLALIVRNRIYRSISEYCMASGKRENWQNVVSVIRELEKIELIRLGDGKYRMDHAITARQKDVLRIFGIGEEDMKEKLGKEAETLWISSAANGKENKKNGETD